MKFSERDYNYRQFVKNPRIIIITTDEILKNDDVENEISLKFVALSLSLQPCKYEMKYAIKPEHTNTIPARSINGIEGQKYQINRDKKSDIIAAKRTDIVVAFLEKSASKKITTIPGVKKFPLIKFIDGDPIKSATKVLLGLL